MMYSEFITLSGKTENYISYMEYTNEIEPIYMDCKLSKADFIKLMNDAFEKIVYPAVEKAIKNLTEQKKYLLAFEIDSPLTDQVKEQISKIDSDARKIAYEYMKLYSKL